VWLLNHLAGQWQQHWKTSVAAIFALLDNRFKTHHIQSMDDDEEEEAAKK
jgi:hypothetical protein